MSRRRILFFASLMISMSATSAQAEARIEQDEIVVTGELQEQVREKAQAYVKELGVAAGEQQAARWIDPVCPQAIGLGPDHAAIVEERMRRIVAEVGAPLAKRGCAGNLLIAFTDGPEQVLRRVTEAGRELSRADAKTLKTGEAPIRWWYNTEFRGRDGERASDVAAPWAVVGAPNYMPLPSGPSGNLSPYNSSMISTQAVRAIHSATVIVDVERSTGAALSSVIDYAALVGLSEVMLGASPPESVLSLFQSGGSRALTGRDRAFLTGLYQIPMDRRAGQQRRAIVQTMVKGVTSD